MLSVTEADWRRITESLAEEQRIQKMGGVSLLLPISNATNAKKRNAAMSFVDKVFSSRNLRRKTHNVQDAWEGSEKAIHEEIDAILQFIQENAKKTPA
jgi:ubiquinone/menaquinone biosynthesis C-methylase UbiE